MDSTTGSVHTNDKSENSSQTQDSSGTGFILVKESPDSMETDPQKPTESCTVHAALHHISNDGNKGCAESVIHKELSTVSNIDSVSDVPLQDGAGVSGSHDTTLNFTSQINEITTQTRSRDNQSPRDNSSISSQESVHNVEEHALSTTEKGDNFRGAVDKEYHERKTSNSDIEDEHISHEHSAPTNLPQLKNVAALTLIAIEAKDDRLSHSDTYEITPSPTKINNVLPSANENLAEFSKSSSKDEGNHTSRSIRKLFPSGPLDQATSRSRRSDSLASDDGDKADETGDTLDVDRVEGDVVLVTGGCGFLGQHIVKLLQLQAPHVAEVRVLDLTYFEKKLDYQPTKRIKSLVGDISNSEFVNKALKGVNSVFHVAGVVSFGTFPDLEGMEKVNVKGTLNVVKACLKNNVQRLVYCSTVDVVVGNKPIRGGTEEDTPVPDKFLFPGYPETKYHGERIVQGVGQYKRDDGGNLQTIILRSNVLYGELDKYYITNALRMAHQSMGILYKIGNGKAMFQQAYVGNTAWAFVCADIAMKANPELTKQIFYIPDNTPVQNSFNFLTPYLEAHGFKLSNGYLSYALSHSAVAAAEIVVRAVSPIVKINLPVQSCTIAYINTDLYFMGKKAKELLNYEPIYTSNEAREMSMKYYANIDLEENLRRNRNVE